MEQKELETLKSPNEEASFPGARVLKSITLPEWNYEHSNTASL